MKKILWCGGSHLGTARKSIGSIFCQHDNDFYITAAPKARDWSVRGGRYVNRGSLVSGSPVEKGRDIDLSNYDHIVFVGQFVQISRYFCDFSPVSDFLMDSVIFSDNFLLKLPAGDSQSPSFQKGAIYNEPLELFPKLMSNDSSCWLIPDPLPNGTASGAMVPIKVKKKFIEGVRRVCDANKLNLFLQPDKTFDHEWRTLIQYNADKVHMGELFWDTVLAELRSVLI